MRENKNSNMKDLNKNKNIKTSNKSIKQISLDESKPLKLKTSISKNILTKSLEDNKLTLTIYFILIALIILTITLLILNNNFIKSLILIPFIILIVIKLYSENKKNNYITEKLTIYNTILSLNKLNNLIIEKLYESENTYILLYTYDENIDIIELTKTDTELYSTETNLILNFK